MSVFKSSQENTVAHKCNHQDAIKTFLNAVVKAPQGKSDVPVVPGTSKHTVDIEKDGYHVSVANGKFEFDYQVKGNSMTLDNIKGKLPGVETPNKLDLSFDSKGKLNFQSEYGAENKPGMRIDSQDDFAYRMAKGKMDNQVQKQMQGTAQDNAMCF